MKEKYKFGESMFVDLESRIDKTKKAIRKCGTSCLFSIFISIFVLFFSGNFITSELQYVTVSFLSFLLILYYVHNGRILAAKEENYVMMHNSLSIMYNMLHDNVEYIPLEKQKENESE